VPIDCVTLSHDVFRSPAGFKRRHVVPLFVPPPTLPPYRDAFAGVVLKLPGTHTFSTLRTWLLITPHSSLVGLRKQLTKVVADARKVRNAPASFGHHSWFDLTPFAQASFLAGCHSVQGSRTVTFDE
jgi:hypothetical protein